VSIINSYSFHYHSTCTISVRNSTHLLQIVSRSACTVPAHAVASSTLRLWDERLLFTVVNQKVFQLVFSNHSVYENRTAASLAIASRTGTCTDCNNSASKLVGGYTHVVYMHGEVQVSVHVCIQAIPFMSMPVSLSLIESTPILTSLLTCISLTLL